MKILSNKIKESISETINKALAQRGFPSVSISQKENAKYPRLDIISEKFNTTPVIMKSIQIDNFGGSISETTKDYIRGDDITKTVETISCLKIWIPVHVSYSHFDGGTNGTSLFDYSCLVVTFDGKQYVTDEIIK